MNNSHDTPTESTVESNRIIYTPSAFARSSLIHLQETGILHALKEHKAGRKNLDSFLFFVVHEGCGKLEYAGDDYELKAGDCAFVDCRMPYRHMTDSEDLWTLQWCHFNGTGLKYKERGGTSVFHPRDISRYSALLKQHGTVYL